MISDVTKHKNNPPEMIYVQTVRRAASQSKGSFAPWVWSSSLIISVQLFPFFLLIRYHQSPKPADGILNFAAVFGLFCSATGAHSIRALRVRGPEEDNLQKFKHQQEAGAPYCALISSVKRHLNDTSLQLVLQSGEKP